MFNTKFTQSKLRDRLRRNSGKGELKTWAVPRTPNSPMPGKWMINGQDVGSQRVFLDWLVKAVVINGDERADLLLSSSEPDLAELKAQDGPLVSAPIDEHLKMITTQLSVLTEHVNMIMAAITRKP